MTRRRLNSNGLLPARARRTPRRKCRGRASRRRPCRRRPPPQAARPPRRRQRGAATGRRGWRRSCYHRRDCCRRSVTAAFRPRRTTGRMNCARCVRSDSSGSRARASPPSFRSASMKSSKTSSPLACAASCRRGSCRTSSRSAPPSRPSLLRSLLRSFAPSLAPSLPLHLRPRPALATRPRPSLLGRGRTSLSARCPRTRRTYLNGTSNRKADVRVRCARKNEHTLLSVDEPQVHSYVLVFSTPLACELNCVLSYAPRP